MIAVDPDEVLLSPQNSSRYRLEGMNSSLYEPGCRPEVM